MTKASLGGVACIAAAIGFALVTVQCGREADASERLVRVEADFSVAGARHGVQRGADGTTQSGYERMVDAVYVVDGKTYRHSVSEAYALRVVPSLPGRGVILVDARDPTRPPRRTPPVGIAGIPLLASIFSAIAGVALLLAARRAPARP